MKIMTVPSLVKDLVLISIPLIIVVYYLFLRKINNIQKIEKAVVVCSLILMVGISMGCIGAKKNFKAIDNNIYNKMPIPKEKINDIFGKGFDVEIYNDANHIVLSQKEIKEYDLCDIYYIEQVIFTENLFYSFGDILKSIGVILCSFSFSLGFILIIRHAKLIKIIP